MSERELLYLIAGILVGIAINVWRIKCILRDIRDGREWHKLGAMLHNDLRDLSHPESSSPETAPTDPASPE